MSRNIIVFKVKQLENFIIPIKSLFLSVRPDYHPNEEYERNGDVTFDGGENSSIFGKVVSDNVLVTEINCTDECSGTFMEEVLKPAFPHSKGTLIFTFLYEGNDVINKITVVDGKVTEETIEI
jgi:hypothetical protein